MLFLVNDILIYCPVLPFPKSTFLVYISSPFPVSPVSDVRDWDLKELQRVEDHLLLLHVFASSGGWNVEIPYCKMP